MKEIILSFTEVPVFFIYIYFFSFFFIKRKNIFKKIILVNSCLFFFFSLQISTYLFKLPLYPKKNVYEKNIDQNYSLILVPTSGFKRKNNKIYNYPSKDSLKRLDNALNVLNYIDIPIYISGGKTIDDLDSEAEVLIDNSIMNIDNKKIISDKKSLNSYETGKNISNYLKRNNYSNNIILITDLYHYKRMSGVLKKKEINPFFIKKNFIPDKINKSFFIPDYKNFSEINRVRYSYLGLINYLYLNKIDIKNILN